MATSETALASDYRLGSAGMTDNCPKERRTGGRSFVNDPEPFAFYHHSRLYYGRLIDISARGAGLMLDSAVEDEMPSLYKGRNMECYLIGVGSPSKFRGIVEWVQPLCEQLFWGITFIELSPSLYDPLRVLIKKASPRPAYRYPIVGMAMY
jgi:hypothetical protein